MVTPRANVARDRTVLADSDTFELDLKGFAGISAIDLIIRATNGSTSNQGVPIRTDVDTIEVVDGSRVLYSLSGIQARCLNCFERGSYPSVTLDESADAVQEEVFRISFGRWVGDSELWLNPAAFMNPRLRVTVTFTISATAGFATGTGRLTAIVHTWDQPPSGHRGMLLTKEYKNFTSAASGDDRTDLPADMPYRMVLLRAFETGIEMHTDITQVKLTLDQDTLVPYDLRTEQLRDLNAERWGPFEVDQVVFRTDADAVDCGLHYPNAFGVNSRLDLNFAGIDVVAVNNLTLNVISVTAVPAIAKEADDVAHELWARGYAPHGCLALPFGDPMHIDTWLNPSGFSKFEAVLTQGGAGAAVSIFGQQMMA